jgi:hypothetical protein
MNNLFGKIEELESKGFVFIIKWDGERSKDKRTVIVSKNGSDFFYRKDGDDLIKMVEECIQHAKLIKN